MKVRAATKAFTIVCLVHAVGCPETAATKPTPTMSDEGEKGVIAFVELDKMNSNILPLSANVVVWAEPTTTPVWQKLETCEPGMGYLPDALATAPFDGDWGGEVHLDYPEGQIIAKKVDPAESNGVVELYSGEEENAKYTAGPLVVSLSAPDASPSFMLDRVVTMPSAPMELIEPDRAIARSEPWIIKWDPTGKASFVHLQISTGTGTGSFTSCAVEDDGEFVIEPGFLEKHYPQDGELYLLISRVTKQESTLGEHTVIGLGRSWDMSSVLRTQ